MVEKVVSVFEGGFVSQLSSTPVHPAGVFIPPAATPPKARSKAWTIDRSPQQSNYSDSAIAQESTSETMYVAKTLTTLSARSYSFLFMRS